MLLPCLLKTRISTASSATSIRSSVAEYPTPAWVSFQSATLGQFRIGGHIIRTMALAELRLSDWWRVAGREILSGLALGTILGVIGFMRIALWSVFSNIYGPHWVLVAITVGLSLVGVVLWATLSGSMLPLILRKLGADPATSSAPFVATLVDVTGLVIYFTVAIFVMRSSSL
jgi:Mg/Co/Ni transporter MgtE